MLSETAVVSNLEVKFKYSTIYNDAVGASLVTISRHQGWG
jgi:hypothetical protein